MLHAIQTRRILRVRRISGIDFFEAARAIAIRRRVEIKVRGCGIGEVMVAGQVSLAFLVVGQVEEHGHFGGDCEGAETAFATLVDAGEVVEGGDCACCDGNGGLVGEVAGVVLRSAAEGDVVELETF